MLRPALVLIALAAAPMLHAQPGANGFAYLHVCNKGTVKVNVATATQDDFSLGPLWDVLFWTQIAPGECARMYQTNGLEGAAGDIAYIGFGFYDSHKKWLQGTVDHVPDFGYNEYNLVYAAVHGSRGRNVLMRGDASLCVNQSGLSYSIKALTTDCASILVAGRDGGLTALPAAFSFQPVLSVVCCGEHATTSGGLYVLNVAPDASSPDLHASVGTSPAAAAQAQDTALRHLLNAAMQEAQRQKTAAVEQHQQVVNGNEEANRQKWGTLHFSPAVFDPKWMGQTVVVLGTVSGVDVDTSKFPNWLTIYFKESPDSSLVVCSPYPDMFQETVGTNLNAMIGKTLEVAGPVEGAWCGHHVPKASIRVLASAQWQLR